MAISTATALGAIGGIAGALGKGKSPSQVNQSKQGFESYPAEIQEYMIDKLFPRIQAESEKPFKGIEKRAIDETDTDPIFGSTRRVAYDKGVKDQIWRDILANAAKGGDTTDTGNGNGDLSSMFISSLEGTVSRTNPRGEFVSNAGFAGDMASFLKGGNKKEMNKVLEKYGVTPENVRTISLSPSMMGDLRLAAQS
jgi:hypothetical protein